MPIGLEKRWRLASHGGNRASYDVSTFSRVVGYGRELTVKCEHIGELPSTLMGVGDKSTHVCGQSLIESLGRGGLFVREPGSNCEHSK